MARKKVARRKKTAKAANPLAAMKERLAKLNADLRAVKAEVRDTAKRTKALEKEHVVAATKKKAAAKKKTAKKRRATRKKR